MLSVIMLSVVMLSVIYAECHYAECRYAECRGALDLQDFFYFGQKILDLFITSQQ